MKHPNDSLKTRRDFLREGALLGAATVVATVALPGCSATQEKGAVPVTATEDLMREHGVLSRLLLIFEEIAGRLQRGQEFPSATLSDTLGLFRRFIQDYHEKNEEDLLFPRFEKAGKMVDLVQVLRRQHEAGRRLLGQLQSQATPLALNLPAARQKLAPLFTAFSRMYRPHTAREDTVLFPAFRSLLSPADFISLGDKFEDKEQNLFGPKGFEKIVSQVAQLETSLGINNLDLFFPPL